MGDYDRRGSRNRGSRSGGRRFGGDRDSRGPVRMHKAVCDKCGKECEVPFRPSGDKPIYCDDCFGKGRDSRGRSGDRGNSKQFDLLNEKLDKILKILSEK